MKVHIVQFLVSPSEASVIVKHVESGLLSTVPLNLSSPLTEESLKTQIRGGLKFLEVTKGATDLLMALRFKELDLDAPPAKKAKKAKKQAPAP